MSDVVLAALIAPVALIVQGVIQAWIQGHRERQAEERADARAEAQAMAAREAADRDREASVVERRLEAYEALVRAAYAYRQERAATALRIISLATDAPQIYDERTLFSDKAMAPPSETLARLGEAAGVARVWTGLGGSRSTAVMELIDELIEASDSLEGAVITGTTTFGEVASPWESYNKALDKLGARLGRHHHQ